MLHSSEFMKLQIADPEIRLNPKYGYYYYRILYSAKSHLCPDKNPTRNI